MNKTYISKDANVRLKEYLAECGRDIEFISSEGIVPKGISGHPDVFLCKIGCRDNSPLFFASRNDLGMEYPYDSSYNAACTGKYFIHNFSCTAPALLHAARELGMIMIDVPQGYAKCSTAIVDEDSIITYDRGIAGACSSYPSLDVLLISPGNIRLDGYRTGFIGGCSGRIGDTFIFNGDVSQHPDFALMIDFVESKGLTAKWFPEYQLTDIGSIL